MNHLKLTKRIGLIIILIITIYGCATVGSPSGGPKDETPPQLSRSKSTPDSLHLTNFNGNTIKLAFDEDLQISNLNNELIVTPALKHDYKHKVTRSGKTTYLELILKDTLKANTTYTFNFGKSIKDLTEGNVAENTTLTFSTGPYLDSLSVSGRVIQARGHQAVEQALVTLYSASDTSILQKTKPSYYTYTNKSGYYQLNHLKSGAYILNAILDKNKNLAFDSIAESIAFLDSIVVLDSTSISKTLPELYLFHENVTRFSIKSISKKEDHIKVTTSRAIQSFDVQCTDTLFSYLTSKQNELVIHQLPQTGKDTLNIRLTLSDSNNVAKDTVIRPFFDLEHAIPKNENSVINRIQITDNQLHKGKIGLDILFNTPIYSRSDSLIKFALDQDTVQATKMTDLISHFNASRTKLSIELEKLKAARFSLFLEQGAFISIKGDTSTTLSQIARALEPEDFGTLAGKIVTTAPYFVFQLLDDKNKVVHEQVNQTNFHLEMLRPATYSYKLIIDDNNNGKWDAGSYSKKIQPEHAIIHSKTTKLKANWEITEIQLDFAY